MNSKHRLSSRCKRGSVLVSAVAAMVLLTVCGVSMAELFSSQRMQSAQGRSAQRTHFVAEAGLWYCANLKSASTGPIAFAGGSVEVKKLGDAYTAVADWQGTQRTIQMEFASTIQEGPLDEALSASSARAKGKDKFVLELVSNVTKGAVLLGLELNASSAGHVLHKVSLEGPDVYHDHAGTVVPTGQQFINSGKPKDWTIQAGSAPELEFELYNEPVGKVAYELLLYFTNDTRSVLFFTLEW